MTTKVTEDQFEWRGDELVHVPTGASFHPMSDFVSRGRAGERLEDGRDFDLGDITKVARQIIERKYGQ